MTAARTSDPVYVRATDPSSTGPDVLSLPDSLRRTTTLTMLGAETAAALRAYAEAESVTPGPDALALEGYLVPLLGMVRLAGGRVTQTGGLDLLDQAEIDAL